MQRWLLVIVLLVTWCVFATLACAGNGLFSGFSGAFLRAFIGYALIVALTHAIFLVLPKVGIGSDPRNE